MKIMFFMKKALYLLFSAIICLAGSCKQPNLTPAYIEITYEDINNCVDVSNYNETHSVSYDEEELAAFQQHNFTHVNVYVNGKNLGCWQVPCKVPVLDISDYDTSTVVILPAFRKTGMTTTIQGYPFFNVLQKKLQLRPGETYGFANDPLSFIYSPYAVCPFLEIFSNSSSFSPSDSTNSLTFTPTTHDGRSVGAITMTTDSSFDVKSIPVRLPARNYYVYLEITYKIDANMDLGIKLSTGQYPNAVHPLGGMYATNGEWKTIYFELESVLQSYNYTGGTVTDATIVLSGIGDKNKNTNFYIDNIKIIYEPGV